MRFIEKLTDLQRKTREIVAATQNPGKVPEKRLQNAQRCNEVQKTSDSGVIIFENKHFNRRMEAQSGKLIAAVNK